MPYYHNDDIINPNGIDFVEVDKLVNPPNESNAGKVVGIGEDGKAALVEVDSGLPEVTSEDNGDVLTVVSGAWAKASAPVELPAVTADDNGDVLTVVNGVWAKAEPQSGESSINLYATEMPTTDPDVPEGWIASESISAGLSTEPNGVALTISELNEIFNSGAVINLYDPLFDGVKYYKPNACCVQDTASFKGAYIEIVVLSGMMIVTQNYGTGFDSGK